MTATSQQDDRELAPARGRGDRDPRYPMRSADARGSNLASSSPGRRVRSAAIWGVQCLREGFMIATQNRRDGSLCTAPARRRHGRDGYLLSWAARPDAKTRTAPARGHHDRDDPARTTENLRLRGGIHWPRRISAALGSSPGRKGQAPARRHRHRDCRTQGAAPCAMARGYRDRSSGALSRQTNH